MNSVYRLLLPIVLKTFLTSGHFLLGSSGLICSTLESFAASFARLKGGPSNFLSSISGHRESLVRSVSWS